LGSSARYISMASCALSLTSRCSPVLFWDFRFSGITQSGTSWTGPIGLRHRQREDQVWRLGWDDFDVVSASDRRIRIEGRVLQWPWVAGGRQAYLCWGRSYVGSRSAELIWISICGAICERELGWEGDSSFFTWSELCFGWCGSRKWFE